MNNLVIVLTCEHASNQLPTEYQAFFQGSRDTLDSHEGWDPGALELVKIFGESLKVKPFIFEYSRLLIEVNRSLDHPKLFSEVTQHLALKDKSRLIDEYYTPYREKVETEIKRHLDGGKVVLHLSVHTFTPIFFGTKRSVEIGLLFDGERANEANLCKLWKTRLSEELPDFAIEYNQPYDGADDGFTTYLRGVFAPSKYLGIELEVSQKFEGNQLMAIGYALANTLLQTCDELWFPN